MPFLPCLSDRSQLCGSYLWRWCLGKGMYSSLCALGQWCLDGICICGPGDWTFFGTPLFLSYWDLLSGPRSGRIYAEYLGVAVGPPWLVTEAPDQLQTVDIWLQILVGWGRVLQTSARANSLIYMLKRVGLKLHPCLTPRPRGKKCVCFLPILITHLLFVYMDFIMLYVFPPTPLSINLYSRPSCQIESNALFEINKAWEDFAFVLVCLVVN